MRQRSLYMPSSFLTQLLCLQARQIPCIRNPEASILWTFSFSSCSIFSSSEIFARSFLFVSIPHHLCFLTVLFSSWYTHPGKGVISLTVDLTITISVILGISAILAPILTTILSNIHDNHVRKQDRLEQQRKETVVYKRKVLETYLQKSAVYVHTHDKRNCPEYAEAYSIAYLYVPEDLRKDMEHLDHLINDSKYESYYPAFTKVHNGVTAILKTM